MKNKAKRIFGEICRQNLSLMMLITLFDLFLIQRGEDVTICFGLLAPQRLLSKGISMQVKSGEGSLLICGWALAVVCLGLFAVCLISSYRNPGWLLCAAAMVLLDTALAIVGVVLQKDISYYIDIVSHVWTVAVLVVGYILLRRAKNGAQAEHRSSRYSF